MAHNLLHLVHTIYPLFTVVIISMTEHFSEGLGNFLLFLWPSGSKDL